MPGPDHPCLDQDGAEKTSCDKPRGYLIGEDETHKTNGQTSQNHLSGASAASGEKTAEDPISLEEEQARKLEFEAEKIAAEIPAYYDHNREKYVLRVEPEVYQTRLDKNFMRDLRFYKVSTKRIPARNWSQADIVLRYLQKHRPVDYVGPLAGYHAGHYLINGSRILVTNSPRFIEPRKGDYSTISKVLVNLLGDQLIYFISWLSIAVKSIRSGERRKGHVVVFAGPRDCGKTFVQENIITPVLGGRQADPYQYVSGTSPFNGELFEAEHLSLDDKVPFTDIQARRRFGAAIKEFAASERIPCHPKYNQARSLTPYWRLTVSCNNEPENLMILPPLDVSLLDKIMIFETFQNPMPMPTATDEERLAFRKQIESELTAFIAYLLAFETPAHLVSSRYGIQAYQSPAIIEALGELQPENRLLEIIDHELFTNSHEAWEGTATRLESALKTNPLSGKLLKYQNSCGTLLSRLAEKCPKRIQRRTLDGKSFYTIHAPNF